MANAKKTGKKLAKVGKPAATADINKLAKAKAEKDTTNQLLAALQDEVTREGAGGLLAFIYWVKHSELCNTVFHRNMERTLAVFDVTGPPAKIVTELHVAAVSAKRLAKVIADLPPPTTEPEREAKAKKERALEELNQQLYADTGALLAEYGPPEVLSNTPRHPW